MNVPIFISPGAGQQRALPLLAFALLLAVCPTVAGATPASLTFSNGDPVAVLTGGSVSPYPSQIVVSNTPGLITKVMVKFNGLNHTYPSDLDVLLVGPGGQSVVLLSDAGDGIAITNVTLTFDDDASSTLPSAGAIVSGTYRPTNYDFADVFTNPAPAGPYGAAFTNFIGSDPNGIWSLYVVDDFPAADNGSLSGGWSLTIYYDFDPAATPREDYWVPDGPVHALAEQDGVLYLGGKFNSLRPNRGNGIAFDLATLEPQLDFPQVNGEILAVAPDSAGGFYIGGDFTRVGDLPRTNLAYITPDRVVSPWLPAVNGRVLALATANGVVYVGGEFTSIGGKPRSHLAALNGASGDATDWEPTANGNVTRIVVDQNTIYLVGAFTSIASQPRAGLAAVDLDGTGQLLPWNPDPQGGTVNAMLVLRDNIYVGGTFTNIGGVPRDKLAVVDAVSGLSTPWTVGPNPVILSIDALAAWGDMLYVGGSFYAIGGSNRQALAALDLFTGVATAWNPNPTGAQELLITALCATRNTIFAGGNFSSIGGQVRDGLAALAPSTGLAQPWSIQSFGGVKDIALSGQTVFASGPVLANGRILRQNAAALDVRTGQPIAWNPAVDGEVWSILPDGNSIYLGGDFLSVGGQQKFNLALVNRDSGSLSNAWNPSPNGPVYALSQSSGGQLLVGGGFTQIGGQSRNFVAALNSSGTATSWNPSASGPVYALAVNSNTVYVGGSFLMVGGQFRTNLAAVQDSTGSVTGWNPGADQSVQALAVRGSNVIAAGGFTNIGGLPRRGVAQLDAAGLPTSWNATVNGDVTSLLAVEDILYFGGSFSTVASSNRQKLAAVSLSNSSNLLSWNPAMDGPVNALTKSAAGLYAAGDFSHVGQQFQPRLSGFPLETAPRILSQPLRVAVFPGSPAMFSVIATGQPPISFQWQFNGTNLSGAVFSSLNLANVQPAQGGDYSVWLSNRAGLVQSRKARLTVIQPVVVLGPPQSQTVAPGANVVLSTTVTGSPPPQVIWYRNGYLIPGAVGPTLRLDNVETSNGGVYGAIAFNGSGVVATSNATLTVSSLAHSFTDAVGDLKFLPAISTGSRSGNNLGATKEVSEPEHAGNSGGHSVWAAWQAPQTGLATFDTRGSTFDTLLAVYLPAVNLSNLISWAADDDSGGYGASQVSFPVVAGNQYWIAVDGYAGDSGTFTLNWSVQQGTTTFPRLLQSPVSVRTLPGSNVFFSVLATNLGSGSQGGLAYQWFHGGRRIPDATNATLAVPNVQERDLGNYSVTIAISSGQSLPQIPAQLIHGVLPRGVGEILDAKLRELLRRGIPLSALANRVPTSGSYAGNPSVSFATVRFQPVATAGVGVPEVRFIPLASDCGWLLMRENPQKNYATFTNDTGRLVGLLAHTEGNVANLLSIYRNEGSNLLGYRVACRSNGVPDFSTTVTFSCPAGSLDTVVFDPVGGTSADCYLTNYVVDCSRPLILPVEFGETGATLAVFPLPGDCNSSYQWLSNGVPILGATSTTLLRPYPLVPANYSVVVSNWVGLVTNTVAQLIHLEIVRVPPADSLLLTSTPVTTDAVLIEASTNMAELPPVWRPYYTNTLGDLFSLPLPPDAISNWFFRARPLPPE